MTESFVTTPRPRDGDRTEFLIGPCLAHPDVPPPSLPQPIPHHEAPPPHQSKHVSFACSHTLTSVDDTLSHKPIVARNQRRFIGKWRMGEQQQQGKSALGKSPKSVLLNRQATAWYRALASIIPGHERFSWNLSF